MSWEDAIYLALYWGRVNRRRYYVRGHLTSYDQWRYGVYQNLLTWKGKDWA